MAKSTIHRGCYHGTSLENAQKIEARGFEIRESYVCFTPLNEAGLIRAKKHGRLRAVETGDDKFGVVEAVFGPQEEVQDANGEPQIELPQTEIGSICVMRVLFFEATGRQDV
jgi:hypothetical protein